MKQGRISRIIGPVVDVRFDTGELPPVLGALRVESPQGPRIVEVHEHLDQTTVRGIMMKGSGVEVLYPEIIAMIIFSAVVFTFSWLRFSKRIK